MGGRLAVSVGAIGDGRRTAPATPLTDKASFDSIDGHETNTLGMSHQLGSSGAVSALGSGVWDGRTSLSQFGPTSPGLMGTTAFPSSNLPTANSQPGLSAAAQSDDTSSLKVKSRPSSFILDLLPNLADRAPSPNNQSRPNSNSSTSGNQLGRSPSGSIHSVLAPSGPNGLFASLGPQSALVGGARCDSPSPLEQPLSLEAVAARLVSAETSLAELSALVKDEVGMLRTEISALRNVVLQSSMAAATPPVGPPSPSLTGGGHTLGPRFAAAAINSLETSVMDSPMVTLHSPSPSQSPRFPLAPAPVGFDGRLADGSAPVGSAADEHIRALEHQLRGLSTAVAVLMSTNNGQPSTLLPPSLGGTPLASPGLSMSVPGPGPFGRQSSMPSPHSPSLGLGVSNTPLPPGARSPLMRPHSNGGLSRQVSGAGYSRDNRGGLSPAPGAGAFDGSNWDGSTGMSSPSLGSGGGGGGGGGPQNPPGSLASKWEVLGVGKEVFNAIAKYGLGPPSKVLARTIPTMLRYQDVVSQAPSIQERIQSYSIPALELIVRGVGAEPGVIKGIQVIIVTATVDQSAQAQRLLSGLGASLGIRTVLCTGQGNFDHDKENLIKNPAQVVVGTPRGLLEMFKTKEINLADVRLLAIDETDQLIARNLSELVHQLVRLLPPSAADAATAPAASPLPGQTPASPTMSRNGADLPGAFGTPTPAYNARFGGPSSPAAATARQTCIISCTVPQDVLAFAQNLRLHEPVRVLIRREGGEASNVSVRGLKQYAYRVGQGAPGAGGGREWKLEALAELVEEWPGADGVVVFCSSVDSVEAIVQKLGNRGLEAFGLAIDLGTAGRKQLLERFKRRGQGGKRVLVVYEALARSLAADLGQQQVALVVNFDLPRAVDDYVHRFACAAPAGGGGRHGGPQGGAGVVVNFTAAGADVDMLRAIEGHFRCRIAELPTNFAQVG